MSVFKSKFEFGRSWENLRFVELGIESWGDCKWIELDKISVLIKVEKVWEKKIDKLFDIRDGEESIFEDRGIKLLNFSSGVEKKLEVKFKIFLVLCWEKLVGFRLGKSEDFIEGVKV